MSCILPCDRCCSAAGSISWAASICVLWGMNARITSRASGRPTSFCASAANEPAHHMNTSSLLWGLLFGSIGLGFFVYGRKQKVVVPLVCGVALMIFPYFVSNTVLLVALGVVLIAIPYFVRM